MMSAVLMFCIAAVQSVFVVLYGILDSFGGLMYAQNHQYMSELEHQTGTEEGPLKQHRQGIIHD